MRRHQAAIQAPANSGQLSATGKYEVSILTGKATDQGGYFGNIEGFDLALPLDQ